MSPTFELHVLSQAEARLLMQPLRVLRLGVRRARLDADNLLRDPADRDRLAAELNRHLAACGCGVGMIFFLLSGITCAVAGWGWMLSIATVLVCATVGGTIGRYLALSRAARVARRAFV